MVCFPHFFLAEMIQIFMLRFFVFLLVIFAESKMGASRVRTNTRCTSSHDKENITAVCRMSDLRNILQSFITPAAVNAL